MSFQIRQIDIPEASLKGLSNRARNQTVGCMHAHNELSVLNRLLLFSMQDTGSGPLYDAAFNVQLWTVMQLLAGKLYETWLVVEKRFLKSNPIDPVASALEGNGKDALAWLTTYFEKERPSLRTLRDKTAFHYDNLNTSEAVEVAGDEDRALYLAPHPANTVYFTGSALIFRSIFAHIADASGDTSNLGFDERVRKGSIIATEDIRDANFHLSELLYGLIKGLLPEAMGSELGEVPSTLIPVVGAPRATQFGIPPFITIGDDASGKE